MRKFSITMLLLVFGAGLLIVGQTSTRCKPHQPRRSKVQWADTPRKR